MLYLTGVHALNIPCDLRTTGDWHREALHWDNLKLAKSGSSVFGDWGIERGKRIPNSANTLNVANHIRACLDLIAKGQFGLVGGMRRDYIHNDDYDKLIFDKVSLLKGKPNWTEIDAFMCKEYTLSWLKYRGIKEDKKVMDTSWQALHGQVILDFLQYMNKNYPYFVLKGGTALLVAYGLDRFSEDIDLDGLVPGKKLDPLLTQYCKLRNYTYRESSQKKGSTTANRYMLEYGGKKALKLDISYRNRSIPPSLFTNVNGIAVYNIATLLQNKLRAYMGRDKIRDLYDILFICERYGAAFNTAIWEDVANTFAEKGGMEYIEYLIVTQPDELINTSALELKAMTLFDKLGIL